MLSYSVFVSVCFLAFLQVLDEQAADGVEHRKDHHADIRDDGDPHVGDAKGGQHKAIKISRKCLGIVKQNIAFALAVKLICLVLAAFGIANMWIAIIADVGVMILAVLNAIRCLFVKNL